jgi:2-polyprenyl-6-methoxyphenol hydroxylase-like FAD-dependent oxidoreductase
LSVTVIERAPAAPDKACGEGIMPSGVRALESLGVLERIDPQARAPIDAISWIEADGTCASGRLPARGLGVRRTALTQALTEVAMAHHVDVRFGCSVHGHERSPRSVLLETSSGSLEADLLIAADGARSKLRRAAGLDRPARGARRFGLRQHFDVRPWTRSVEVHLGERMQAFVTPVGPDQIGLAFLWDCEHVPGRAGIDRFLQWFPVLAERLQGASPVSRPRGAGPLASASRVRTSDRLALVGDAAGFVDAVTGEGISLALVCAEALGRIVPTAIPQGATRIALAPYERAFQRAYRRYALVTRAVLALARRPRLRRAVVRQLAGHPRTLEQLMAWALTDR